MCKPMNNCSLLYVFSQMLLLLHVCAFVAQAEWFFDEETGEISSDYLLADGGEVCLTTGWPFLQAGAFSTPAGEEEKSVIILNEAAEAANFVLKDPKGKPIMSSSIPAHSIQTVLFE
mmetsp:Transcript_14995/g.30216  ORF Transcript_14995/g.30216 Transcript_14995/m.30216 type:complete len:117 (-) Transcript_14995:509-859(-)